MPRRILLADYSELVRHVLQDHLMAEGYDVVVAIDGVDASERLNRDGAFDAIVLDLEMPAMDGRVFLARRAGSLFETIPVVAMSAFIAESAADTLANSFGCLVIDKTEAGDQLLDALTVVCERSRRP